MFRILEKSNQLSWKRTKLFFFFFSNLKYSSIISNTQSCGIWWLRVTTARQKPKFHELVMFGSVSTFCQARWCRTFRHGSAGEDSEFAAIAAVRRRAAIAAVRSRLQLRTFGMLKQLLFSTKQAHQHIFFRILKILTLICSPFFSLSLGFIFVEHFRIRNFDTHPSFF